MNARSRLVALFCLAVVGATPALLRAQQGTITGQVTDAETGEPLAGATVEALGQLGVQVTDDSGRFTLQVAAGTHSVVVTLIGHETTRVDGISVAAGEATEADITVNSLALLLNPVVVTASRRQEKTLDAPASIATVSADDVARSVAASLPDHVRTVVGIDAAQTGINQGALVARGFSNVFSGAMLTIVDNRYARVPSLRYNAYTLFPTNDFDIDHIEVSLGPGAALYGPNASNGVLHIITPSPLDKPGSSVSLTTGNRSVFHGQFRTAAAVSDAFGVKVSGQYWKGTDWEHVDPLELTDRDNDSRRLTADVRMDYRLDGGGELVLSGGTANVAGVDMTGLGGAQVDGWGYNYGQARFSKDRLFVQAFLNQTNSGEGTFLLRTLEPVVDSSRTMAVQFQHGFDLGARQSFTYGVDWQSTDPRSGGTIFGMYEDDDGITEVGGYLHSETALGDNVDLVTALRIDNHSRLPETIFSPRAALVFTPAENQNFRLTFNRAFATPTSTNLFLDVLAAQFPLTQGIGYNVRGQGVPVGGFTFSAQCPGGYMGYCMRSPFLPGQPVPANAGILWDGLLDLYAAVDPGLAQVVPLLRSPGEQPGDPELGTMLRSLDLASAAAGGNPFLVTNPNVEGIGDLVPTIHNTYEAGYKGLIGDRVLLSADVYYARVQDFVGPLRVITPNVFFERESIEAFLTTRLDPLIQAGMVPAEQLPGIVRAIASLPLGTVVPDQADNSDLILSYQNFGDVDYVGADLAAQIIVSDQVRINANFSYQSDECFDFNEDGNCRSTDDIALNAPSHKGSFGFTFDDQVSGFTAQARVRASAGFPMNSGVYIGDVEGYSVVDASVGYRLPFQPSTQLSLTANNVLNNMHREFIGAPEIGRMLLLRLRYDF